ncbi:MAG TPA: type 4a pilus biogenesis protein PilO [Phycisphaerae bacterium]|nr:type 4a pilus biogenesis protein PilO [Phycisphaerae bacterium]
MVLNKRERMIAIIVGAAFALLGLYYFILSPYLSYRDDMAAQEAKVTAQRAQMSQTLTRAKKADKEWKDYLATTLKDNPTDAQIQTEEIVIQLAQACNVQINTFRPEAAGGDEKTALLPTTFRFTGTGNFRAVSHLMLALEEPKFPVKVTNVNLTAQKPGIDSLQVQLALATVSYNQASEVKPRTPAPRPVQE